MKRILGFIKKYFLVDFSYTLSFLSRWVGIVISVVMFYYLSKLFAGKGSSYLDLYGGNYFAFVLAGLALMGYFNSAITGFASSVSREQWGGTLEVLLTTPTRLSVLICSFSSYNLLMGLCAMGVYFGLGCFLGVHFDTANIYSFFVIAILATCVFLPLGIIAAAFSLIFKKGDPITWLVANLFWLLGGVYFPTDVFPKIIQQISQWLPSTHALKALRLSLLKGYSLVALREEIVILCVFACCLGILSIFLFRYALYYVKKKGTISFC